LLVRSGRLGGAKLLAAFEDNGSGNQYLRFRVWPSPSPTTCLFGTICVLVAVAAGLAGATYVCAVFATAGLLLGAATGAQCAAALARTWRVLPRGRRGE